MTIVRMLVTMAIIIGLLLASLAAVYPEKFEEMFPAAAPLLGKAGVMGGSEAPRQPAAEPAKDVKKILEERVKKQQEELDRLVGQ